MIKYTIYSKPNCPWCSLAKHILGIAGVEYQVIECETEEKRKDIINEIYGSFDIFHNTFPIVLKSETTVGKNYKFTFVGGCTDMIEDLKAQGYPIAKI